MKRLFLAALLIALATPTLASRISTGRALQQGDSGTMITNISPSIITLSIPHGLTLPYTVQLNGGAGGIALQFLGADTLAGGDTVIDSGVSANLVLTSAGGGNYVITIAPFGTSSTPPILTGTTGSIGGGALLAGACTSGTVSVTGAATSMTTIATPASYPGDGAMWDSYVSTAGVVTVKVCAVVALTPSASAYNVRVVQ